MKRSVKWLMIIMTVCLIAVSVAACDSCAQEHEHTYSSAYEYDDTGHWHKADCGHDVTTAKEAHTYVNGACSACGRKEDGAEHEHTFPETYEYDKDGHWKQANCGHNVTTDREAHTYVNGVCSVCGRKEEQTHEHTFAEAWESNATHHWHEPTCGDTEEKGSYGEHNYIDTEISALTCETDGVTRRTCRDCGFTKVETTKAAHIVSDADHHVAVAATCEHAGNIEYWECERCDKTFADKELTRVVTDVELPMLAHDYRLVSDKAATCTEYGLKVEKCSMCSVERNTTAEPLGHKWSGKKTCTTGRECERDGCTVSEPELGHSYTLIDSAEADCTHDGSESYACLSCGDRYTTLTAYATGHSVEHWEMMPYREVAGAMAYDAASYGECTYVQVGVCTNENCPEENHTVVDLGVMVERHEYSICITTPATCVAEGVKTYTCNSCGNTHTESIPEVSDAHTWIKGGETDSVITYNCSNDGCNATKTAINAKSEVSAQVSAEALKANELELQNASLKFDAAANIPANAEVAVNTIPVENLEIDDEKKSQISGDVYDFAMLNKDIDDPDNNRVTDFGGAPVSVRIPYTLDKGEDPENIAVWYIDDSGEVTAIKAAYTVVDGQGYVVFATTHFSYYTVTRLTNEERCALYGHSDIVTNKDKTCISDGYKLHTCRRCGRVEKTDIVEATGHEYDETTVPATCTRAGSITRSCKYCDYGYTSTLPAVGHDLVADETRSREATCLVSGITYHVCANCNAEFITTTAQKQHNYSDVVKEATCQEGGFRSRTCKDCGFNTVDGVTDALGHNYSEILNIKATCDTDGKIDFKCLRCNKTDTVVVKKTGHVWDIEEPTCGRAQRCIICSKAGLPATNEHNMVNGVCSGCGIGCIHKYETTKVEPTCTERGYILMECSVCHQEERMGYTPALGHKGNFECERCQASLVGDDYFTTLLTSVINSEYTLKLTNFKVIDSYYGGENSVFADEVYIGLDEDGELCAYGTFGIADGVSGLGTSTYKYTVAIEKGMVYVVGVADGTSTYGGGGSYGFTDETKTTYMSAPLATYANYISFDYASLIPGAYRWLRTDLKKIVDSLILVNKAAISNVVGSLMDRVFTLSASGSDYTLTLNADGIAEINDILYNNSIKNSVDILFGEGSYAKLRLEIEDILKHETGKTFKAKLAYRGVNSDDLIKACDSLCEVIFGEGATLKDVLYETAGVNVDLAAILQSDDLLLEIVSEIVSGDKHGLTAEEILNMIDEYAEMKAYDLIEQVTGADKSEVKKEVDGWIEKITAIGSLTLTTDKNGNLKSGTASAFGPFEELEIDGELKILIGRQTELDYGALVAEIKAMMSNVVLDEAHFGAFWNELGAETLYYESGSIQSARYKEVREHYMNLSDASYEFREQYLQYRAELDAMNIDGGYTILYVMREENDISMNFAETPMIILAKDCGEWYSGSIGSDSTSRDGVFGKYVLKAVDGNGDPVMLGGEPFEVVLREGEHVDDGYTGGSSLNFFVSGVSGEINTVDDTSYSSLVEQYTRHNFVEDKSLREEAVGCEGVGIHYYNCTDCGKRIVEKYMNGHGREGYYFRVKGGATVTDCTKGFDVERVCATCDKVVETRRVNDHEYFTIEVIDLTKYGMADGCGGYAEIYGCFCGEAERSLQIIDNQCDFEENSIYNRNWDDCFSVYTCAVTNPVRCNLRYSRKIYKNGCEVRATYIFGCNADGSANTASRTVDILYKESHDYERIGEPMPTDEPCRYATAVKCRVCGKNGTEYSEKHENTEFMPEKNLGFCLWEGRVYCHDCDREVNYVCEYRHENIQSVSIAPTCSQYGMKGICGVCGGGVELTEPLGHEFKGEHGECAHCGLESVSGVNGRITLEDFTETLGNGKNYVIGYYDSDEMPLDWQHYGTYNSMYEYRLNLYFDVRAEIVYTDGEKGEEDTVILNLCGNSFTDTERGEVNGHYVAFSKQDVENAVVEALGGNVPEKYNVRITFVPIEGETTLDYSITLT